MSTSTTQPDGPATDPRAALADRLRHLTPGATEYHFGVHPDLEPGGYLEAVVVELPDWQFDDHDNGLCYPGRELARALTQLGWTPDATEGDPVCDDVPRVTFTEPAADSPAALHDLWRLARAAFRVTPVGEREDDVPLR